MNAKKQPRFDVDTVHALAGDKVFTRAEAYFHAGQVEILSIEPDRVLAQVLGTEDYRTVVTGAGTRIDGECSCPAFGNWGFCKHMAAVALATNEAGTSGIADGGGALLRIRDHLKTTGVDALVAMIVALAERDPLLYRRLDIAAASHDGDSKTLEKRLRKALAGAIATRGYVDYSHAPGWAAGVEAVLDVIADLIPGGHAQLAFGLTEYAIAGIERAIDDIDDSDGYCTVLLDQAREIHLAACYVTRPDPAALAYDLFTREMTGEYDTFYNAAALYADVLGEEGLTEYRRLASIAWEKLPQRSGDSRAHHEYSSDYDQLASILDFFAERQDDMEARIALRAKDLSSSWNYLQLAEFCLSQDRQAEALRYAEEALWVFEDGLPDEQLVFFTIDLMLKAGRKEDAFKQLWRAFERAPSFELYKCLRKLKRETAARRIIAYLKKRMTKTSTAPRHSPVDLLIRVLMEEKMFDAAWAAVQETGASGQLKQSLANASEATHPHEALAVYVERVEQLVKAGGNPNYDDACALVVRMSVLRGASEQAAYVADLMTRFRRKRNFVKLIG